MDDNLKALIQQLQSIRPQYKTGVPNKALGEVEQRADLASFLEGQRLLSRLNTPSPLADFANAQPTRALKQPPVSLEGIEAPKVLPQTFGGLSASAPPVLPKTTAEELLRKMIEGNKYAKK